MTRFEYTVTHDHDYSESPRQWDNLGTIVTWHRQYSLGDIPQPDDSPADWIESFNADNPNAVILPVYMYDHSGITINTTGFSCTWDSGQVGYIYATKETILLWFEWNRLTAKRRAEVIERLREEIKTYDQFITGDIYQYVITEWNDNDECVDTCVASCTGFYDEDECEATAKDECEWHTQQSSTLNDKTHAFLDTSS